ncbi:MAG: type IV secretory system conjugative DNA transfer family protein [Mycoplasmatales bacterium]
MKINKLVVLKLIPLVILLVILIIDPDIIVRVLNCIVISINRLIINKGLKGVAYYIMLFGVVLLIFRRVIRRSWERFKVKYMAPINTYSKGKAIWSSKRDKVKDYVRVEYDNSYTSGFIVNRVCEVYVFGLHLFDLDFYKMNDTSKVLQLNERLSRTNLSDRDISKILHKYQKRSMVDRLSKLEKFKFIKLLDIVYLDVNPINQLIIGTTRSGKSQTDIIPQLDFWLRLKNKKERPSIIVSDPKGELFNATCSIAKDQGYDAKVLNLSDLSQSCGYNPLCNILEEFNKLVVDFDEYFLGETKMLPSYVKDKGMVNIYAHVGRKYLNKVEVVSHYESLETYLLRKYKLNIHKMDKSDINKYVVEYKETVDNDSNEDKSNIQKEIDLVVNNLVPIEGKDPFWELSGQNLLSSFIYYVLEESFIKMDMNKFNLYNVIAQMKLLLNEDEEGNYEYKDIISKLPIDNYSRMTFPSSSGKTLESIITTCLSKLKIFNLLGLGKLTCVNDFNFKEIVKGDKPNIIYLITPDYDPSLNKLVSLFIDQIYLVAVKYADSIGGKLKRKIQFELDEFANIPKIENITNKLTVCLGRGIQFSIAVQESVQIEEKYGKEMSETIISNMHLKKYILAGKQTSLEFFSKEVGETTQVRPNISYDNRGRVSVSYQEEAHSLITAEELAMNPMGSMVITNLRKKPSKMKSRPAFSYIFNQKVNINNIVDNGYIKLSSKDLIF